MKIGELFVQLGVKGDTKQLDTTIRQMEEAEKRSKALVQYRRDLAKATSDSEKALVKKNFADKVQFENLKKQNTQLKEHNNNWLGAVRGITAFVLGATIAYKTIDRMITSLARVNQQMINFQRQTGISFASLNKYASASASVNYNATIEGTAQSMQNLAQNLWDIQMGRGDISPYQELAFVGGKAFNPMGMSVEQVIESVREAIKGVGDLQATNIITRMGFSPDDLLMLRMSREEFEKINDLFLSPEQREEINRNALEIKKLQLQFQKLGQSVLIDVMKPFIRITTIVERLANLIYKGLIKPTQLGFKLIGTALKNITEGVKEATKAFIEMFSILKPVFSILKMIGEIIWLPIEDVLTYLQGGKSLTGEALEGISSKVDQFKNGINPFNWFKTPEPKLSYNYGGNSNINTSNNFTINSNQPTDVIATNLINKFTPTQIELGTVAV